MDISITMGPFGRRVYLGQPLAHIYLTKREVEVVQLLPRYKYREIATMLRISRRTAEFYTLNMQRKLRCRSRKELVKLLKHLGILEKLVEELGLDYLSPTPKIEK